MTPFIATIETPSGLEEVTVVDFVSASYDKDGARAIIITEDHHITSRSPASLKFKMWLGD